MARKHEREQRDIAYEQFSAGVDLLTDHPLFTALYYHAHIVRHKGNLCPDKEWAVVTEFGQIHVHPKRRGAPEEWAYVLAHCLLHLGFGHFQQHRDELEWNAACDIVIAQFLSRLKLGRPPDDFVWPFEQVGSAEEPLYKALCERGLPVLYVGDMRWASARERTSPREPTDWQAILGESLAVAVTSAVNVAAGVQSRLSGERDQQTEAQQARSWFISSFPLLGSLAAAFKLVEDPLVCQRMQITVAAVDAESREIFINPAAGLSADEMRFVMAHELLHVGLRHDVRRQGRDPFLWNVAADFVINGWLIEMGVGQLPQVGGLYDQTLKGLSAEAIYDLMATDMRRYRKLATLRGIGLSDMLERGTPDWWAQRSGMELDEFYRRCLSQGLVYHQDQERGFLPLGLIEEIQALYVPAVPWDVELARWFDNSFQPIEWRRSFARPSRRQAATPDIPKPRYVLPAAWEDGRTFGVVLDTSCSMDRTLLAKALGAISSYCIARDVPYARVVFCDAAAYDEGYMAPEAIAERVRVRGRGGTILQPGVDLLERAEDFPHDGPILIITDGFCDNVRVRRDHAYIVPIGAQLPFTPRGPVFRVR